MSNTPNLNPNEIDQLMVDAATQGLTPDERASLEAVLREDPALQIEADRYAIAATLAELALTRTDASEPLPVGLREKLLAAADDHAPAPAPLPMTQAKQTGSPPQPEAGFSWTDGRAFGWYAATAALIAVCVLLIQPPQKEVITVTKIVEKQAPANPGPTPTPTIAQQYESLVNTPGTVTATWKFSGDEKADPRFTQTTGQVVWNSTTQTGYMKLKGMPINDPTQEQYQLWIVDGTRTPLVKAKQEETDRIDGGVFDITADGEVIIPINAKLTARQAVAFAITVETPGGVVESQGPLQTLAVVEAG